MRDLRSKFTVRLSGRATVRLREGAREAGVSATRRATELLESAVLEAHRRAGRTEEQEAFEAQVLRRLEELQRQQGALEESIKGKFACNAGRSSQVAADVGRKASLFRVGLLRGLFQRS